MKAALDRRAPGGEFSEACKCCRVYVRLRRVLLPSVGYSLENPQASQNDGPNRDPTWRNMHHVRPQPKAEDQDREADQVNRERHCYLPWVWSEHVWSRQPVVVALHRRFLNFRVQFAADEDGAIRHVQ